MTEVYALDRGNVRVGIFLGVTDYDWRDVGSEVDGKGGEWNRG